MPCNDNFLAAIMPNPPSVPEESKSVATINISHSLCVVGVSILLQHQIILKITWEQGTRFISPHIEAGDFSREKVKGL
jgi:hypothetical protein